jgi:hypothetical protein
MTSHSNVDICVTCISDKPPQLPLREELPSLGVEVVYNARGVGMRATADESKKQLRSFRKQEQMKSRIRRQQRNPSTSPQQWKDQQIETEKRETMIRTPKALSYKSYQKQLKKIQSRNKSSNSDKPVFNSANDTNKNHEVASPKNRSRIANYRRRRPISPTKRKNRIGSTQKVETPEKDIEQIALDEAFKVFSLLPVADSQHLEMREMSKSLSPSSRRFNSRETNSTTREPPTSPASNEVSLISHTKPKKFIPTATIPSDAPGSRVRSRRKQDPSPSGGTGQTFQSAVHIDTGPFSPARKAEDDLKTTKEKKGSIKVKLFKSDSQVTEFFDLTELADENDHIDSYSTNGDLSTLSSKKETKPRDQLQLFASALMEKHLPGLKVQMLEQEDDLGKVVLDLSHVEEPDGPNLSPVLSPEGYNRQDRSLILGMHSKEGYGEAAGLPPLSAPQRMHYSILSRRFRSGEERQHDSIAGNDAIPFGKSKSRHMEMTVEHDEHYANGFGEGLDVNTVLNRSPRDSPSQRAEKTTRPWPFFRNGAPLTKSFLKVFQSKSSQPDSKALKFNDEQHPGIGGVPSVPNEFLNRKTPPGKSLADLLNRVKTSADFEAVLKSNPEITGYRIAGSGRCMMHEICCRDFPDRFTHNSFCRVADLVGDVVELKNTLTLLKDTDQDACTLVDEDGDLPVHLLARLLMEWEAGWYQKVYSEARGEDKEEENGAGITTLYQTMSQCIDLVLKPVSRRKELCCRGGRIGKLLPLHIAAIFTVSYDTLRLLLERHPEAAAIPCDLNGIRTFIPNKSIPLQLHDRLSTDFPKWELESVANETDQETSLTQPMLNHSVGTNGEMRRSDLIFAFYPDATPYRHDISRIRRIETRICLEMITGENDFELSSPARLLWIWLCTFVAGGDEEAEYSDSVKRIVKTLPLQRLKYLANLLTNDQKPLLDQAQQSCAKVILKRLNDIAKNQISIPMENFVLISKNGGGSVLLQKWDLETASKCCLQGRGFVAVMLRSLFNIREEAFPTSFIILPYRLVKDKDGKLGIENSEAASVAMKFADCLLRLTSPSVINYFLQKKVTRSSGRRLGKEFHDKEAKNDQRTREITTRLLALYERGPGYFYFLDESSGIPIVPEQQSLYPLVVNDSFDMVRKILPLMLTGMILMRGDKAYSLIAEVLLGENRTMEQSNWIETAKDLLGYLYSPKTESTETHQQAFLPVKDALLNLLEKACPDDSPPMRYPKALSSEWLVELSLVKMVVEMHDPEKAYSGLRSKRGGQKLLWTQNEKIFDLKSYHVDFKTLREIREKSKVDGVAKSTVKNREEDHVRPTNSSASDPIISSGLDLLFGELSFRPNAVTVLSSNSNGKKEETLQPPLSRDQSEEARFVSTLQKRAAAPEPASVLNFDDNMDLDEVLQLRILLDEQEAKLEFLREKISDIQEAELDLLKQEERVGEMISGINNGNYNLIESPTNQGLSKARSLLIRICELENRVLCKEVEIGQLNNAIACFDLQAKEGVFTFDGDSDNEQFEHDE